MFAVRYCRAWSVSLAFPTNHDRRSVGGWGGGGGHWTDWARMGTMVRRGAKFVVAAAGSGVYCDWSNCTTFPALPRCSSTGPLVRLTTSSDVPRRRQFRQSRRGGGNNWRQQSKYIARQPCDKLLFLKGTSLGATPTYVIAECTLIRPNSTRAE